MQVTEEQANEIMPEPPHTCPMIDEVLDNINKLRKRLRNYERIGVDELSELLSDIKFELDYMPDDMEKIRKNVTKIREWGQEWKDKALDE